MDATTFLIFDFETTGIDNNAKDKYKPYPKHKKPLPRENYPVELAARLIDQSGKTLNEMRVLIKGAERLSPWVLENCTHFNIEKINESGVSFEEALNMLADMVSNETVLVAHNIDYDWNAVLCSTVIDKKLENHSSYIKLKGCTRFCTMINETTKKTKQAYYWRKIQKMVGPKLQQIAADYGIEYDKDHAHDANYDVSITTKCLIKMIEKNLVPIVKKKRISVEIQNDRCSGCGRSDLSCRCGSPYIAFDEFNGYY